MNAQLQSVYLVTGAAGFIGARFVESCVHRGISVISVDRQTYFTQRTEHQTVPFGRIIDRDTLDRHLGIDIHPSAIIHLGACSNTMETNQAYLDQVNVRYSRFLWTYASERKIPFIYASSAATYGDGTLGYDDDEKTIASLKPLNLYGQSKQTFDLWALDQERNGVRPSLWTGFKFFNVYGLGERHKGRMGSVVLHAFDQIQNHGKLKLFRSHQKGIQDGHQKRDFIHVDDVVEALHYAIEKPISRGIYNLGTGNARTFLDLGHAVFNALGRPAQIEFIDTPEEIRDRYQYFTEARMERLLRLGYTRPFRSLEEGVDLYIRQLMRNSRSH